MKNYSMLIGWLLSLIFSSNAILLFGQEVPTSTNSSKTGSAIAGPQYAKSNLKQAIFGKHYRSSWTTEIHNIPYLDLEQYDGGLTPYERGGGAQTNSLKFKSKAGHRFAFRLVDKTPTKRLDPDLAAGLYGKAVQGLTTTQHPYGSTIITALMDELELPHSQPTLYLMPDDAQLGIYRAEFARQLGWLEIKPRGKKKGVPGFEGADKVLSTLEMYESLMDSYENKIDVAAYVKARIFDIWISDWDRHIKNWKWLGYEGEKGMFFKPFPKDRDKALVVLNGIYKALDWEFVAPDMANFKEKYQGLKSLNHKNRSMDRWLANSFTYEDWRQAAKEVQQLMTDEVIDEAIATMPKEVQSLTQARISRVLKIRRDNLPQAIDQYYKMLVKYIDIVGSNKKEYFELTRLENGDVAAKIYALTKDQNKGELIYNRLFRRNETKEIRVHGLGKADHFKIIGKTNKSIKIRIIGGDGADIIEDESLVKGIQKQTKIYDNRNEDKLILNSEAKKAYTPETLTFKPEEIFDDDHFLVLPFFGFNQDDGFIFGLTGRSILQGFNKPEFSQKYTYQAGITTMGNYELRADGQFRQVIRQWDMVTGIKVTGRDRDFQRFYGFGNESTLDESLQGLDFYENNTASFEVYAGFSRQFWDKSAFTASILYDYKEVKPDLIDGESASIYDVLPENNGLGKTSLIGPKLELNIDFRDADAFPTKGMQFETNNYTFFNQDVNWEVGGRMESEVSAFFTKGIKVPTTLSLRGGFSYAYGDSPFYYKSFLGQQGNHRGFLKNRFGGDAAAYLNTDLRFHLGATVTPIVPIKYGIFGLFDLGRVWSEEEESSVLHSAVGGGIYIIPYKESFNFTFTAAHSDEKELLFSFRLGFFVR